MKTKPIPHPIFVGFTWVALMFAVAIVFLGAHHTRSILVNAKSAPLITGDQWLSLFFLLAISFVTGCFTAWIRRQRQPNPRTIRTS